MIDRTIPPRVSNRPPRRGRVAALCLAAVLAVTACGPRNEPDWQADAGFDPTRDPLFDPQAVTLEPVLFTFFEGLTDSILPLAGWGSVEEGTHQTEEPITFAWATAEEATIRVQRPSRLPVDFLAKCLPFDYEGAPPQTLTLAAGDRTLGSRKLEKGWQEIRLQVPDEVLAGEQTDLRLVFARADQVNQIHPESTDARKLAAACQYLALVPRSVRDAEAFLRAAAFDPASQRLSLAVGTSAELPLPADAEMTLRLGEVRSACRRCRMAVVLAGGDERQLWQGEPADASDLELGFKTPPRRLSWLRLSLSTTAGDAFDPGRKIDVRLPPSYLAASSQRERPEAPPHVFVYLIDTLRADSLTPYGSPRPASPSVERLAEDAVTYLDVWSASAWTLPSVVSILTGTYPYQHQIMQGRRKLSDDSVPTLSALLADAGYETFGISQSFVASSQFGIHTGFHHFLLSDKLNRWELRSQEVRRHLLRGLRERERPEAPIFAYLHSVDPHGPYGPQGEDRRFAEQTPGRLPPEMYTGKVFLSQGLAGDEQEVAHLRALYDGEVAYADRQLGAFVRLLQYLGLYDDSLIVVLSDHGEEFGEHGGFEHGRTMYEEMLQVPLIIKYPHSEWAGETISQRVSTVDLVPTVLRVAGVDPGGHHPGGHHLDGHSLRPPDLAERPPSRSAVFAEVNPAKAENLASVDYRAFALGDLKCIESLNLTDQLGREIPPLQAFDLAEDPREQHPLAADDPRTERCRDLLGRWLAAREKPTEIPWDAASEQAQDELRALGYIE